MVPTALKMTEGMGVRVGIRGPHLEVSVSRMAESLGEEDWGRRREMVVTEVKVSLARRVLRMWLPTAPVLPKTAAVVMIGVWGDTMVGLIIS